MTGRGWTWAASIALGVALAACGSDDPVAFEPTAAGEPSTPGPGGLRRLTATQYVNTVRLLFGDAAAAAATPPADHALSGLDAIGASELAVSDLQVERYEASAMAVANAFVADPAAYPATLPCVPTGATDPACFHDYVAMVGRWAWRRPLSEDEIAGLVALAEDAASVHDSFEQGIVYATGNLLQSPHFTYQVEVGEPTEDPLVRRLTADELATRMAFVLLDRGPDPALLHNNTHQPSGTWQQEVRAAVTHNLDRLAYLLERFAAWEDGANGETLLDNVVVYASSDCSDGWSHTTKRQPVFVAGRGGGKLVHPGIHHPTNGRNISDILLTVRQIFDPSATEVGGGDPYSNTPFAELLNP